jgi:hypothetical protein
MNPAEFATASLPADACTLDTQGSYGPDRITRDYGASLLNAPNERAGACRRLFRVRDASAVASDN